MAMLVLAGSVGSGSAKDGIPHNQPADVAKVRDRLVELGYTWVAGVTQGTDTEFIRTLKLFQSILKGSGQADKGDGRVSLHGDTHRWLAANNAPGWAKIGAYGYGWHFTTPLAHGESNGAYGTTWLMDRIRWAGFEYAVNAYYSVADAPPLWIRDCSPEKGGNAVGHKSHETGLDVDMRLPLLPPYTDKWDRLEGKEYGKKFHYEAALVQVKAIRAMMEPSLVLFNDPRFTSQGLSREAANHGNHYHIRIKPPTREDGTYK